ncbi:MAG: biopolymer transporter ExbD [Planctomycetota bacterium]|nr:MAG: biopolymer transporter ExbD [Planctomycetota bacterium]
MAKKSRVEQDPEPKPELTPMIDIVFNLIIFFMIVSELSNLTVEDLQLAYADQAAKPPKTAGAEKILQINVMEQDGLIKVRGHAFTTDAKLIAAGKYDSLAKFLGIEATGYEREEPIPGSPGPGPSKMRVNIRADKDGAFQRVQEVFDACMRNGIYKTSLAASKDDPGGP